MTGPVVVTGIGVHCASGAGCRAFEAALFAGESAVRLEGDDPAGWRLGRSEVDFEGRVPARKLRRLDETMRKALVAALEALHHAALPPAGPDLRLGVVTGTGFAGARTALDYMRTDWEGGPSLADPSHFPNSVPNGPTGQLGIHLGATGPGTNFFEAGTAGENSISFAREAIAAGDADAMLVVGVDERSEPIVAVESALRRAQPCFRPETALRPFDQRRSGTVFGDATAALLLESEEHALARGARPLAILHPVALGAEATPPGRWPSDVRRYAAVLRRACALAGTDPGFVVASARGDRRFDAFEAVALASLPCLAGVPVTAPKGHTGDLSSFAILGAVVAVLGLVRGEVPPVARLEKPDPAFALELVRPGDRVAIGKAAALVAGSGPGGTHGAFLLEGTG